MKIYFQDQQRKFTEHLADLCGRKVMSFDKESLPEKSTSISITTPMTLDEIDLRFFFNYLVFPPSIMKSKTQWEAENRNIRVGDTIVQQVCIPPIKTLSQKLIFGVRINTIIEEAKQRGFSYETLDGHVERGESTFMIAQNEDKLVFTIRTFSEPAYVLIKIFGSWASVPYQQYCTRRALENVKRQMEGQTHGAKLR